jgi:two-component sensor histidine kinase
VLDLNDVVSTLSGMLRRIVPADIEIVVANSEETPEFRADLHAVEQMLFNLATNARDAMPAGGVLRIETRCSAPSEEQRIAAGARPASLWTCLAVEDTGVGMDEATRQRVFEPFFTTKSDGKGTGLGMATVYGLVKQHGGVIEVDSAPGLGTRIHLFFPAVEATTPAAGDEPRAVTSGRERDNSHRRGRERFAARGEADPGTGRVPRAHSRRRAGGARNAAAAPATIHLVLSDLVMPRLGVGLV